MRKPSPRSDPFAVPIIALFLLGLILLELYGTGQRFPSRTVKASPRPLITSAETQKSLYGTLKTMGIRGATLVEFGRYLHIVEYFPLKEATSTAFPIGTYDIRSAYEERIDSHNWVFIAAQSGIIRRVIIVVPDRQYLSELAGALISELFFRKVSEGLRGHLYDIPTEITVLEDLGTINEPVVAAVDANYFSGGAAPLATAQAMLQKLPRLSHLIAVSSVDENEVTDDMRVRLSEFRGRMEKL